MTPTTTLIEEAGITKEQVAEVLGLPAGVDPLTFNPYATGVNAADALAVAKASQQIMSVVNAFAGAAEGAGASEAEAFEAALNSVVEVVKTKATKLSDANASAADKTLDLTKCRRFGPCEGSGCRKSCCGNKCRYDCIYLLIDGSSDQDDYTFTADFA